jgi:hypothetical protein
MQDRKQVYEEQIQPLVQQIDAICVKQGMPFTLVFQVSDDETMQSHYVPSGANQALTQIVKWWLLDAYPEDAARAIKPPDQPL